MKRVDELFDRDYYAIRFATVGFESALANLRKQDRALSHKQFEEHGRLICETAVNMADYLIQELAKRPTP
jgi:hypothetical protein